MINVNRPLSRRIVQSPLEPSGNLVRRVGEEIDRVQQRRGIRFARARQGPDNPGIAAPFLGVVQRTTHPPDHRAPPVKARGYQLQNPYPVVAPPQVRQLVDQQSVSLCLVKLIPEFPGMSSRAGPPIAQSSGDIAPGTIQTPGARRELMPICTASSRARCWSGPPRVSRRATSAGGADQKKQRRHQPGRGYRSQMAAIIAGQLRGTHWATLKTIGSDGVRVGIVVPCSTRLTGAHWRAGSGKRAVATLRRRHGDRHDLRSRLLPPTWNPIPSKRPESRGGVSSLRSNSSQSQCDQRRPTNGDAPRPAQAGQAARQRSHSPGLRCAASLHGRLPSRVISMSALMASVPHPAARGTRAGPCDPWQASAGLRSGG